MRWAMEDPNPKAIEHKKRKNIEAVETHTARLAPHLAIDAVGEAPAGPRSVWAELKAGGTPTAS